MIDLIPLADMFTIYQLTCNQELPAEIFTSEFFSITKTNDEISILTNNQIEDIDLEKIRTNDFN